MEIPPERYYVCVSQVSPPEGILFVPVSKEHCFYR